MHAGCPSLSRTHYVRTCASRISRGETIEGGLERDGLEGGKKQLC
jgi:hypothetical protein